MSPTPTDEQLAICDALRTDGPSIMGRAYAGTGKSSTIALAAPGWRKTAIALGFNKTTAKTLEEILPSHFTAKSFNGLGHGIVAKVVGKKLTLDDRKLGKLVTEVAKGANIALTTEQWHCVRATVTKAMLAGIVPGDEGWPMTADAPEVWEGFASDAGAGEEELEVIAGLAKETLIRNNALTRDGLISFDDQVYFSACLAPPSAWTKYPLVIGDEWQDANGLNHRQVERLLGSASRLLFAGDSLQSIYAFRGSLPESMEQSRGLRGAWVDLPLTMSFRCPKVVVGRQAHYAKGYRAHEANPEGSFERWPQEPRETWGCKDVPIGEVAMICRNNAPLLSMGFKLIRRGVGVKMLGRDLGKGLEMVVNKVSGREDAMPIAAFIELLKEWEERECTLATAAGRDRKVEQVQDQAECLLASASASDAKTTGMLKAVIEKLFTGSGLVTLSSIHQAKGKEWRTVIHLDPWRVPSRRAKAEGGVALKQEMNAIYVLETRTRERLIEANLEDFE